MRDFNRLVATSPDLESTLLPIGDGMIVAVKK
jgi:predicted O-methyltransferase YrrM